VLAKTYCPASLVTVENPPGIGSPGGAYAACDAWHRWAVATINRLRPDLLVVSQESIYVQAAGGGVGPAHFSPDQWTTGLTRLFGQLAVPVGQEVYLGNIPRPSRPPPQCLAVHARDVQACSTPLSEARLPLDSVDRVVARAAGVRFIDPTPWLCSSMCTAVVGHYVVYLDQFHITGSYARYAQNALGAALGLSPGR